MAETIFGRTDELAQVSAFLDEMRRGPSALVWEGETGVGKTVLWRAAVAEAAEREYRVLTCNPAESEASMAYSALGDLLQGVLHERPAAIPAPQERALKIALLLADADGPPPDQRAVSVATLGLLRAMAADAPVLVAADDLQFMDRASARVLDFALHRLEAERIGFVATHRSSATDAIPALSDRGFSGALHRVSLAPLQADALDALFRARLRAEYARPTLSQIAAASRGNPLFALELGRAIQSGEVTATPGEPLPVPRTLQQFVGERLADLPADVLEVLFVAAAASEPTIELLERTAQEPADVPAAVEAAVSAGVVTLVGDRLEFTHPLFASTVYHGLRADQRRELHRRLARALTGSSERALHLALGARGPDAAVAIALDQAARRAADRGAPQVAAELCEQAYRLTPEADAVAAVRRRIRAAEHHFAAGDPARARRMFEEIVTALNPGPFRASILRRLARVRYRSDSSSVAAELLTRALHEAGDDSSLRAGIERDLSWAVTVCGDVGDAAQHARSGLALIEGRQDDEMLPELLAAECLTDFLLGDGLRSDVLNRAIELERPRPETPIEWRPGMMLGMMMKWAGDLDGARRAFDVLHVSTREAGDETSLPFLLSQMSETATWDGEWDTARRQAAEAEVIALQSGQEPIRAVALYARALVEAHLGLLEEARTTARAGLDLSREVGSVLAMMMNQSVLGFIELSSGDPAAAHGYLGPLTTWLDVVGIREPGVIRFVPDEVEALVALGELGRADELLTAFEADAARLDRRWALLAAARCRAMLTAARGDVGSATASLERQIADHAGSSQPFERARALFVLGSIARRGRRRKAAAASLRAALDLFDHLGARAWSARVGQMLESGKPLSGDPTHRLTPAEQRVAELVASGATNREAAGRLFVSVRAVEVHLTSIYRKLGIRSRTELALKLAAPLEPPAGEVAVGAR